MDPSSSGIRPVPEVKAPGVKGVPPTNSSMSKSAWLAFWKLPSVFLNGTFCPRSGSSSFSGIVKPTDVCLRFGDMGRNAERFAGESFFETDLGTMRALLLYAVRMVGTLNEVWGFARFGVDPL